MSNYLKNLLIDEKIVYSPFDGLPKNLYIFEIKKIKNQIICNAYIKFYILRDDGDKEILKTIHGGNVFRSNFMEE